MTKPKTKQRTPKEDMPSKEERAIIRAQALAETPKRVRHFLLDQPKPKAKQVGMRVDLEEFASLIEKAKGVGCTSLSNYMRKCVGFEEI